MFEEWCVDFARTKWEPNFIDVDFAIQKIRETDETFINFDRVNIFKPKEVIAILKRK